MAMLCPVRDEASNRGSMPESNRSSNPATALRVLHVYPEFDPGRGGPPYSVASIASAQCRLGARVAVLAAHIHSEASRAYLDAHCDRAVRRVDLPARGHVPLPHAALSVARAVRGADVVHLHGVWNPAGPLVAAVCKLLGRPYVISARGMLDDWSLDLKGGKKRLGLAMGFGQMLGGAAALHLLNEDEARTLTTRTPLPERRVVIPNGIFPEDFADLPAPGTFRARHPALGDSEFILFLARLHPQKGVLLLAEAFREVAASNPDVHLVLVGPDQGARAEVEQIVGDAGLTHRVHLPGPIYGQRRFAAFVDAAVYCLPSYQEGFSIAITEALACGTPCVISEEAHWPEVRSGGCGAVTPLESGAIARGLLRVLSDPAEAEAMGRRGRSLVHDKYTWPVIAERMLSVYASLVRPSSSAR